MPIKFEVPHLSVICKDSKSAANFDVHSFVHVHYPIASQRWLFLTSDWLPVHVKIYKKPQFWNLCKKTKGGKKKIPGKCVMQSNSGGSRIVLFLGGGVGVGGGWSELMNRSIQNGKSPDRLDCHFSIFKFGPLSNKDIMFAIMNSKEYLFVNHILLMAKKCIYSSRCNKMKPSLQYYIR